MMIFWTAVVAIKRALGHDVYNSAFTNRRGYRRAIGGRWGLWEVDLFGPLRVWMPSGCEHYPPPMLAMHAKPLATEGPDALGAN